jgi:hypothetical protein
MNCGVTRSLSAFLLKPCDTHESVPRLTRQVSDERYSALMRHTQSVPILLASFLLASAAFAQTWNLDASNTMSINDPVMAARSRYTQGADILRPTNNGTTLAQFPRHGPEPPFPARRRYPRQESYQNPWLDHGNAGHAVIGVAIGFGIGAMLGAIKSAHDHTPAGSNVLIGGSLLGFIGGTIGVAHGGAYFFAHHRKIDPQSAPEDENEEAARSKYPLSPYVASLGTTPQDKPCLGSVQATASIKSVSALEPQLPHSASHVEDGSGTLPMVTIPVQDSLTK